MVQHLQACILDLSMFWGEGNEEHEARKGGNGGQREEGISQLAREGEGARALGGVGQG